MLSVISSGQMQQADQFTISTEGIESYTLMERASKAWVDRFTDYFYNKQTRITVFCGNGNNGGDGMAISRLLIAAGYHNVKTFKLTFSENQTEDNEKNATALLSMNANFAEVCRANEVKNIEADVIIDAILGSGLNKPLSGEYEKMVEKINAINIPVFAVDVPSGLFSEGEIENYNGIKASRTIAFQRPKLNFFFPESKFATLEFDVVNIGLNESFIQSLPTDFYLTEEKDIVSIIPHRKRFDHKGTFGHALLVCGQTKTMGAALLSAEACLQAGTGLITACIPDSGLTALNTALPEAMFLPRDPDQIEDQFDKFNVVAAGCGLGTSKESIELLERIILLQPQCLLLDADALNILASAPSLLDQLPRGTILTPHVKEFDRMFGTHTSWWQRIDTARKEAFNRNLVIVLKNQYTFVCDSNKNVFINPTGNPAMAQGGMGDVLTGIIAGLWAQNLSGLSAAIAGCFIHGKAGDTLASQQYVVSASKVAERISFELMNLNDK